MKQHHLHNTLLASMVGICLVILPISGAFAQDGDEPTALAEKLQDARRQTNDATSLTQHIEETEVVDVRLRTVEYDIVTRQYAETTQSTELTYILNESGEINVHAFTTLVYAGELSSTGSPFDSNLQIGYTLEAEFRIVDGVLSVNAAITESAEKTLLPQIPDGWAQIDDPDQYPGLSELHIVAVYLDDGQTFDGLPNDDILTPAFFSTASAVSIAPISLEDETSAEQITLEHDGDALLDYYRSEGDSGILDDSAGDNLLAIEAMAPLETVFVIDADMYLRRYVMNSEVALDEDEAEQILGKIDTRNTYTRSWSISVSTDHINDPELRPVGALEIAE